MRALGTLIVLVMLCSVMTACAPTMPPGLMIDKRADIMPLAADANQSYRMHAGDVIEIKFYFDDKLDEKTVIAPDGRITLQLVGEVMAAGLTREELRETLQKAYAEHDKRDPNLVVMVREFSGQSVYIGGEIRNPGVLQTFGNLTVLQAVFQSGGFLNTAEKRSVVLLRKTAEGHVAFATLDLDQDLSSGALAHDAVLQPFDVVYVPKSRIAQVNQFVEQYIDKVLPFSRNVGFSWIKDINGSSLVR